MKINKILNTVLYTISIGTSSLLFAEVKISESKPSYVVKKSGHRLNYPVLA